MPHNYIWWNINGLSARAELVKQLIREHEPDFLGLGEVKVLKPAKVFGEVPAGYTAYWNPCLPRTKPDGTRRPAGHGTGVLVKTALKPKLIATSLPYPPEECKEGDLRTCKPEDLCPERSYEEWDAEHGHQKEGRLIAVEVDSPSGVEGERVTLVLTYTPNIGDPQPKSSAKLSLPRLAYRVQAWDRCFARFLSTITTPIIWGGDLNVAPEERDVYSVKNCKGKGSFTNEERASFAGICGGLGLFSAFRAHLASTLKAHS